MRTRNCSDAEWAVRIDLAAAYRLVELHGWGEAIYNHIAARVPGDPDHLLMNRNDITYNEVCASNLVKVDMREDLDESAHANRPGLSARVLPTSIGSWLMKSDVSRRSSKTRISSRNSDALHVQVWSAAGPRRRHGPANARAQHACCRRRPLPRPYRGSRNPGWDALRSGQGSDLRFCVRAQQGSHRAQMATLHAKLTSLDERLADMDAAGVDVQAIFPAPHQYYYWSPADVGLAACRAINESIAQIVESHPRRFVGMGCVPLQEPRLAVEELQRMARDLGLRGVEIGTNVNGQELSSNALRPFFAKAEELGLLVFMHPLGTTEGRRLSEHYLVNLVGNPLDSTIALSRLIFDGVLAAHPSLNICIAHGGGYLPFYPGRLDHGHSVRPDSRERISEPPSTHLRKIYFDTVVFEPRQLAYLVDLYGADHVLLGTDYPYDMGEPDPVGFIARTPGLTSAQRALICGGNAARLLGLERSSS